MNSSWVLAIIVFRQREEEEEEEEEEDSYSSSGLAKFQSSKKRNSDINVAKESENSQDALAWLRIRRPIRTAFAPYGSSISARTREGDGTFSHRTMCKTRTSLFTTHPEASSSKIVATL
eukprot:jgi/Bigna1/139220/aug1.49_g13928